MLWVIELWEDGQWRPTRGVALARDDGRTVLKSFQGNHPGVRYRLHPYRPQAGGRRKSEAPMPPPPTDWKLAPEAEVLAAARQIVARWKETGDPSLGSTDLDARLEAGDLFEEIAQMKGPASRLAKRWLQKWT